MNCHPGSPSVLCDDQKISSQSMKRGTQTTVYTPIIQVRAIPAMECALMKKKLAARCDTRTARDMTKHAPRGKVTNRPTSWIKYLRFHSVARSVFSLILIEPLVKSKDRMIFDSIDLFDLQPHQLIKSNHCLTIHYMFLCKKT